MTNEQNQTPDAPASAAELRNMAIRFEADETVPHDEHDIPAALRELATLKASKQTQAMEKVTFETPEVARRMRDAVKDMEAAYAEQRSKGDEADELLKLLNLDPNSYRTEGGFLNMPKVRAAMKNPEMYPRLIEAAPIETQAAAALYSALVSIDKICNDDSGERTDSDKVAEIDSIATHYVLT